MKKEKSNLIDHFKTSDLSLAAAISLFFPVESIDKQIPQRANFIFKSNKSLVKFVEDYWQGKLRVEPQSYFDSLRKLKTRIYGN